MITAVILTLITHLLFTKCKKKNSSERTTRTEVEEIVENGELDPDSIHTPGIYVHRLVLNATPEKRIEQRTLSAA
jgi:GTPase Era involved in 16S rRNA processing